jgi:hypothetical protein
MGGTKSAEVIVNYRIQENYTAILIGIVKWLLKGRDREGKK